MDQKATPDPTGCAQVAAISALMLWFGAIPAGVTALVAFLLSDVARPGIAAAAALLVTAPLLLIPFIGTALLTRRRTGWAATAATAAALAALGGSLILDGAARAALPNAPNGTAALQLGLLLPYALFAAWAAPRLAGTARQNLWVVLGLERLDLPGLLVALALAALLTLPWPLTGALGDRLTSLEIAFHTLAATLPQVLLVWGLTHHLLTATFARAWVAGLTLFLIYGLTIAGGVFPTGNWGVLTGLLLLLPMALLLTELRAQGSRAYALTLLALAYRSASLLFVDPRDAVAQGGIPEMQHVLSHIIVIGLAATAGPTLTITRALLRAVRDRRALPAWIRPAVAGLAALVLWTTWLGAYAVAGSPGFYDDGFLIILEEQADLSAAATIPDREARIQFVYDTLVETATRSQADLRAELDDLGVPYRPYFIINMIRVDGHHWLMGRFEDRPGVDQVLLNPNVREYPTRIPLPYGEASTPPVGVQPNLDAIDAEEAWELGVTGTGIVVAGQDTGYDWTHPALQPHYRGWDGTAADHDYDWHDAWDATAVPFDDDSHGTHTMGTVLGDDGGQNRTGVAPGAVWIGCRNMRRGFGNPGAYAECMEFFLAPFPHGGDSFTEGEVSLAPHVINNSWGCPDFEGCFADTLEPAVEALRAAGIMMVVSAGNEGPGCASVTAPPANYDASFSVGATSDGGTIVGFSSRGPVDGLVKPDVSAPGETIRSSVPGGGYGWAGGTSMAGPHVTGLVALLWSADPALVGDIDATEALICRTATPRPVAAACAADEAASGGDPFAALFSNPICACGDVAGVPNNVYGCGVIDAGAAVQAALE
ncbi:MAG: S8 family serine peptidase [Anaerolineae bacterium]|nr:S8 family serine peptidase [Anaerolineae bacterium]